MAHPIMFDPDDPVLARVRTLALAFPGADEKVSHGRPTFFTRRIFLYYGGSSKVDARSQDAVETRGSSAHWVRHEQAVMVLPDPGERRALEADGRFWVPAYLGPSGWLGLDLDDDTDFTEVAELVEDSYRQTAPVTLVRELDRRRA